MNFDRILDRIGQFGKYQIYMYVLMGLTGIQTGIHNLASVFVSGLPDSWCRPSDELDSLEPGVRRTLMTSYAGNAAGGNGNGNGMCAVYDLNYTSVYRHYLDNVTFTVPNGTEKLACTQWEFDNSVFDLTIVNEWDLVCSRGWLRALSSSIYMFGFLIGAIGFGNLSDRLGRKKTLLLADLLLVVAGCCAAFVPSFWGHVVFRMLCGTSVAGTFTVGFVVVMEAVGVDYRMVPGIFYQGWFAIGYMLLSGVAYFVRNFRYLYVIISVYPVIFLSYYWLVGDSPRWLLATGKDEEAEAEIRKAARMNGVQYPEDLLKQQTARLVQDKGTGKSATTYTILDLLRTPNMRRKSLNIFYNWFVNSIIYYGLSLGVADLAGSPYINLFISGLAEFPGYLIAAFTLDRVGRRWPLALLLTFSGVCCLLMVTIPSHLWIITTILAMLGKMCISGSFAVIYVYSAEIFPTVVRTLGVGAGSMCARIGGLVAPFIAELGYLLWGPLPNIIFGVFALTAGGLTLLLPETLHRKMPETLEEGEEFGKHFEWFPDTTKPTKSSSTEEKECSTPV